MERHKHPAEAVHAARRAVGDLRREERARLAGGVRHARDGSVLARRSSRSTIDSARRCSSRTPSTSTICSCCPVRMLQQNPDRARGVSRSASVTSSSTSTRTRIARSTSSSSCSAARTATCCVVGDDDQSIYGWRGADIRNILDFEQGLSRRAAVVRLEENYRSTPQMLDLANVVISENTGRMGKTLRATLPSGERGDAGRDARRARRGGVRRRTRSWRDAVGIARARLSTTSRSSIARTRRAARSKKSLRKRAMPYRLVGAVRFYDRREIRDLMAYLKLIANPGGRRGVPPRRRACRSAGSARRRSSSSASARARGGRADVRGRARTRRDHRGAAPRRAQRARRVRPR